MSDTLPEEPERPAYVCEDVKAIRERMGQIALDREIAARQATQERETTPPAAKVVTGFMVYQGAPT